MKALIKSALERIAPRLLYFYQIRRLRKEEPEIQFLAGICKKTAISLDVGANLGLYCYHMLPHSSAVVAFEPLPEMQQRLKKHFGSRISLVPVALSDHNGECQIRRPKGSTSWATIEPKNTLSLSDRATIVADNVPVCRLDDYKFQNVGVIKIDVEGHEEAVLHGGLQTIAHERPALIVEIEERHNPGAIGRVVTLLAELGYRGYFVDKKKMVSMEEFDSQRDQSIHNVSQVGKVGRYINNFIFLPTRQEA